MSLRAWLLGLAGWALFGASGEARPFTVEDLLNQEAVGEVTLDPTGRFVTIERWGPYAGAARFDRGMGNAYAASRVLLADLGGGGEARPIATAPACALRSGPWSPDGRRIVVYRICGPDWELGVAEAETRAVRWSALTPASGEAGERVVWRSATSLLVLARPDRTAPWSLRTTAEAARRLPAFWAASARGEPALTVFGSGAYRETTARPPDTRLVSYDPVARRTHTLLEGPFTDLSLSPSARRLALLEVGERLQPGPDRTPQGAWGLATERHRLAVLDLTTGRLDRPWPTSDVFDGVLSWSPWTDRLAVFVRPPGAPWTAGHVALYDARRHAGHPLDTTGLALPIGRRSHGLRVAWLGGLPAVRGRGGDRPAARDDWWLLSAGAPRNLTAGLSEAPATAVSGRDRLRVLAGGRIWALSASGAVLAVGGRGLSARPTPARASRTALEAAHGPDALAVSQGGQLVDARARPTGVRLAPGETLLAAAASRQVAITATGDAEGPVRVQAHTGRGPAQVLATVNLSLADVDRLEARPIRHRGPAGEALTSWLFVPPRAERAPPLIVRPYLGDVHRTAPRPRGPILGLVADPRVLVGQGYAVLVPSLPLPMSAREPLAGLGARVLGIVDAASAQAPGAFDPQRLAILGHSYGGYSALAVAAQTDRFRAVISMAGPTDLTGMFGTFQPSWRVSPEDGLWTSWTAGWLEDAQGRMGTPPWRDPDRYVRNSPLFLVARIRAPVLLIHGDQDPIPATQSEAMFAALHRLNRDAQLVVYWGEGHIISSPGNVRDLYARTFDWLSRNLSSQP